MGANLDYRIYKTIDRKKIQKEWDNDVEQDLYDNGHSYSGGIGMLGTDIQWQTHKAASFQEASDYIQTHHVKWEPPMAVGFPDGWVVGGWCSS
jgi:hypothetical protein